MPSARDGTELSVLGGSIGVLEYSIDHRKDDGATGRSLGIIEGSRQCVGRAGRDTHDSANVGRRKGGMWLVGHIGDDRAVKVGVALEFEELSSQPKATSRDAGDRGGAEASRMPS